jgi:PPM family protein phosphatase
VRGTPVVDPRWRSRLPSAPLVPSSPPFAIDARGATDVGRRREQNEDAFLVDLETSLFIVADGMGGHAGGGTASSLAVRTIQERIRAARAAAPASFTSPTSEDARNFPSVLRLAVESACRAIYGAAQEDPSLAGMGTTVTAVLVAGRTAFVAHVGDSRCYLVRGGRIFQLSEDHSLVNEQLKAGAITEEEARQSRFRNIITRSVGFEEDVLVDVVGLDVEQGDTIVLCCDGLTNLVADTEILEIATGSRLAESADRLIGLANERGGDDNITVIVVKVDGNGKT